MAGYRINDYAIGDVDLTSLMESVDNQRIGFHAVSLTEFDTTSKPKIAQGSRIEVNGALFIFDDSGDEDISGSPSDGIVYIKLTPAGESITASFTNDAPTWDDEKQGWYEALTNNRYLEFEILKSGANYTQKRKLSKFRFELTGELKIWPTDTPPSGFLLCYGQAISRTGYAHLFSIIGETFGVGDGATTFNLPDMRGRLPLGQDDMGGSSANRVTAAAADSIGGSGGEENHTLSEAEMPSHRHGITKSTGAGSINESIATYQTDTPASFNTAYAGSGSAHNNLQPYLTINYIIKY